MKNFKSNRPDPKARRGAPAPAHAKANSQAKPKDSIPKEWRMVIGHHAVDELIAVRPQSIKQVWIKQGWESSQDLQDLHHRLKAKNIHCEVKSPSVLDKIAANHQGAILFSSQKPELDLKKLFKKEKSMLVLLDGIEDPHNLGAILRTSWLMGVDALLVPQDRAVGLTSSAHKVACGGVEHVPVHFCNNFQNILSELKENGYWVFGLDHKGKAEIYDTKISDKVVWCIGAEDKGLRTTTQKLCDELVRIPQAAANASYNASVATAIALSETRRQILK